MSLPDRDLRHPGAGESHATVVPPAAGSSKEALDRTIQEAERALKALKLTKDPDEMARYSARFQQLLAEGERIKQAQRTGSPAASIDSTQPPNEHVRILDEPRSTRKMPTSEKILLLNSGFLNECKFPPWEKKPDPKLFELNASRELYEDPVELGLSKFQEGIFGGWKRPQYALPPPSWFPDDRTNLGPGMSFPRKVDLVQDAATDCSVVASMCAGTARAQRGHATILRNVIFPYDEERCEPTMSPNGKYIVRLNFNGCYRSVVIDDRLPVSNDNRVIHVVDRHNPGLLWPALVEKAYLKVRGGYDFPGSNSGTDLWILTGWIPEQIFLQSDELEPERFWERITSAFRYGDVLITSGTGKMSPRTVRETGLASEHDYAVLDLRVVNGQRLCLIKNPWCEGTSWRGRFQDHEKSDIPPSKQRAEESLIELNEDTGPVQSSRDLLNADDQLSPGTFWMDLDNVIQHFESMYLNWNPGLFTHRQDLHFEWDLSPPTAGCPLLRGRWASIGAHPQFTVTASRGGTIWVLLSRHFRNTIPESATSEQIETGRQFIDIDGHIALAAFASGQRVLLCEKYVEKSWLVDSPQTLLKMDDCVAGQSYTVVPLEDGLAAAKHTFTISAFSRSPLEVTEARNRYAHANTLHAAWTTETAGGNAHSPMYSTNPQFSIAVPERTALSLLLETPNDELNVNLKLVHSKGQRVHSISKKDIVFDSKDYRRGCCLAEYPHLEPGQYTIICSTFEPKQLAEFALRIESSLPTHTTLLPREGAGRLRMELANVGFKRRQSRVAAPLLPKRLIKFNAIARYLDSASVGAQRSLVRLSVEQGRGDQRRILVASGNGEYGSSASGVRTEDVDLRPELRKYGDLWLVLDRMYVGSEAEEERFSVELFLDTPQGIECGDWRAWDE